jgi:hypothetical protein
MQDDSSKGSSFEVFFLLEVWSFVVGTINVNTHGKSLLFLNSTNMKLIMKTKINNNIKPWQQVDNKK